MKEDATYLKSNEIESFDNKFDLNLQKRFKELREKDVVSCEELQLFSDELTKAFGVNDVVIVYTGKQPHSLNYDGVLRSKTLGTYYRSRSCIYLYKYTAKRNKLRATKSLLDTLLHEFVHHFDYTVLGLEKSLHTSGFYKRIGWLKNSLLGM